MLLPDGDDSCEITDLHALDEAAIYLTLDAMREVHRPEAEIGWEWLAIRERVAWKQGQVLVSEMRGRLVSPPRSCGWSMGWKRRRRRKTRAYRHQHGSAANV